MRRRLCRADCLLRARRRWRRSLVSTAGVAVVVEGEVVGGGVMVVEAGMNWKEGKIWVGLERGRLVVKWGGGCRLVIVMDG